MTFTERFQLGTSTASVVAIALITATADHSVARGLGVLGLVASAVNLGALSQRLLPGIWLWDARGRHCSAGGD